MIKRGERGTARFLSLELLEGPNDRILMLEEHFASG